MDNFLVILKALSDENRLKILKMLLSNEFCVGALANNLKISKPAVSQHIQVLRKAGLIIGEKKGYWIHYSVDRILLTKVSDEIKDMANQPISKITNCHEINSKNVYQLLEGRETDMCKCNCNCKHTENLKDKDKECSDETKKICHGDEKDHDCCNYDKK